MLKKSNFKRPLLLMALSLVVLLGACSNDSNEEETVKLGDKDIEIPYVGDGSTVRSLVLAEVLKDAGYEVTATPVGASGPMYASVSENPNAMHASGRFPSTDKYYLNKYDNQITIYEGQDLIENARVSLAVPKYMEDVDSIDDLKSDEDLGKSVDYTITGTDPRNGVMMDIKDGIEDNDLEDWEVTESSDEEMLKEIEAKYKQQEPIIFTAWQPHWMFDAFELKELKDPDKIFGNNDEHINLVFNKKFKERHPGAYKIATRMAKDWDEDDEKELMKKVFVDNQNPEKVAEDYVDDNSHKVDKWRKNIEGN